MKARIAQFGETTTDPATVDRVSADHRFLTVHEVAKLLRVPASWVYGRVRKRSTEPLPGYRVGKYLRFCEQEILAWVKRHERGTRGA